MSERRPPGRLSETLIGWLVGHWRRLPESFRWNIEDSFQPEDIVERLLPGEEPQLEIHLAWYRDLIGGLVFGYFGWLLALTLLATAAVLIFSIARGFTLILAALPAVLLVVIMIAAVRARIEYRQWRLLKTNARLILSIPQPGSLFLVDNIELKALPNVIDTNWSRNPLWRLFQLVTGARDLYLSLVPYRFVENTARVGDALIFPDVMPEQVFELKRLVFTTPRPQRVVFPTPQEVVLKEPPSE